MSGFVTAESEITNLESEKGTELESKLAEYIEAMDSHTCKNIC